MSNTLFPETDMQRKLSRPVWPCLEINIQDKIAT